MSLVCLAFLVVVTSGYQQDNSQWTGYPIQSNNQNGNQLNYPTDNIYQQQNQRRNPYQSNIQRQNLGGRNQNQNNIQRPSIGINNQQIQSSNHCPMVNTRFKCTSGPGRRVHNSGVVWDPSQEQDIGEHETWNCTPCCQLSGKTIDQCNSNIRRQSNNRQANQRLNQGRRNGNLIDNQQAQSRNHCQMMNTKHQCTSGPGRIIHNSGIVWDPSLEQDNGVDESWNCTACCQFPGKTIPPCDCQNAETNGSDYDGNVSTTVSGYTCQNWVNGPIRKYANVGNHNFCRQPSAHSSVWCYSTNPKKRWEDCNVPFCV